MIMCLEIAYLDYNYILRELTVLDMSNCTSFLQHVIRHITLLRCTYSINISILTKMHIPII